MKNFPSTRLKEIIADYHWPRSFSGRFCLSQLTSFKGSYQAGDYICRQFEQDVAPYFQRPAQDYSQLENGSDTISLKSKKTWTLGEIELLLGSPVSHQSLQTKDPLVSQLHFKKRLPAWSWATFLRSTAKTWLRIHQINYLAPANFHHSVKERLASHSKWSTRIAPGPNPRWNQLALRFWDQLPPP